MLRDPHVMAAFSSRTKQAFVGALGKSVISGVGRLAKVTGQTQRYGAALKSGRQAIGSRANLQRAVGVGTLGVGAGAVAGGVAF